MPLDFGKLKFLLVEDDPATAQRLQAALTAAGAGMVAHAADVAAAVRLLRDGTLFDLMLCDFDLGTINGLSLVKAVRREDKLTNRFMPIIMMSDNPPPQRIAQARDAGVNDFLSKPVHPPVLVQTIRTVLENPRAFVDTKGYFGPTRRRRQDRDLRGRRQADTKLTEFDPTDPWAGKR